MKRTVCVLGAAFVMLSALSALNAATVAWYRMEDTTTTSGDSTVFDVMSDSSANSFHLEFWPGGWGQITEATHSTDVPTSFTFRTGFGGGNYSWDNNTLSSAANGCLFFETGGTVFPFRFPDTDFTVEGFFKTDGDRSAAGRMDILFQSQTTYQWLINLNEGEAGQIRFGIAAAPYHNVTLTQSGGTGKNFADGTWHYFAARYDNEASGTKDRLTLHVLDRAGNVYSGVTETADGFANQSATGNLFVGRYSHTATAKGHFLGKLDELRISNTALSDAELMIELPAHRISGLGHWRMEESGPWGPNRIDNVIADSSTPVDHALDWYNGGAAAKGNTTAAAVPPASMFADGFSGGTRSFDAGSSFAGNMGGNGEVLFLDGSSVATHPFYSADTFTVEAFFNTTGAGIQEIVSYGFTSRFAVYLDNGQLKFKAGGQTLTNGAAGEYANNKWHYVAASYETRTGDDVLTLRAFSDGDASYAVVTGTTSGSLASPTKNLSIGGDNQFPGGQGFLGLIDEVRFSDYVRLSSELLGVPRAQGTVFIIK